MIQRLRLVSALVLVLALAAPATSAAAATVPPAPAPTPTSSRGQEYWLDGYGITTAWQTTRGAGVRIAVIDTGIGRAPAFDGAVAAGTDVSGVGAPDGRTPVGAVDANHGSWVASLAAAREVNGGMVGVAPEAQLLSVSVGFGATATVPFATQIADAIRWSVDQGAKVINLSFTTNTLDWDPSWDDAFLYAFDHDVVVVVAAGNRGSGTNRVGAPATIPGVLTVGGVDPQGRASLEASTQGITIGLAAPSEKLLGVSADGQTVTWNGTSGAAPIVAGIAALVRAAHPELDAANVINRLIRTARPPAGVSNLPDALYGYGLVDAAAAVSRDVPTVSANPMGDLREWIRIHRRASGATSQTPSASPVQIPPLPEADPPSTAASPLLPTQMTLLYGSLPLLAFTVAAILVSLGVTAAVRRVRSARVSRVPRR
ncbi:S8 family serine peptidase [Microbacterium sp. SORGH_AS_0888]|uniref:S8 family serine peptidase n=1 Tax=Microbacterium sp. SORGH_AS_0888 TaxID=3041791 RepID=UPI00278AD5D0|nr:S8 family serine peptidase [Microbacterium sp. SORGH_AS_0888]MDQ1128087.1 membrane-anchored mycosin MYCP [Microbacterium sp. SORGH_AS_0888]